MSPSGISALPDLTAPELVVLDLAVPDRDAAVAVLARTLHDAGRIDDPDAFLVEVARPEHQLATALPGGIGLPHARTRHADRVSIAVGITAFGHSLDFGAADGPASVVLLLATPAESFQLHLGVLASLARSLAKETFRESLRRAHDPEVIAGLVNSTLDFTDV